MASLRSVIKGFVDLSSLTSLQPEDPLRLIHQKFWGHSWTSEKEAWRSENVEELAAHSADVGGSEADNFVDYRDGCYVLPFSETRKIWVRADYLLIYEAIDEYFEETKSNAAAVVLTGQPGIADYLFVLC
jgi:hypothetical protein